MKVNLRVWRQKNESCRGQLFEYIVDDVLKDMSFLEMMDKLNNELIHQGEDPVAFDHDCREGICGTCGIFINGRAHGPGHSCTTCEVRMREFKDGDEIWIEPFRSVAFPPIKDLMVDRSAFDRVIQAGGFVTVHSGPKPDPNTIPISHEASELAMDAAECIGCGACVAACPNGSAMLFTAAKINHLNILPQGQPEAKSRVLGMVEQMDREGFGSCTNHAECQDACPKGISIQFISEMNRQYRDTSLRKPKKVRGQLESQ